MDGANEALRDAGIEPDEAAVRRFVSDQWAEDWDSDEDAVYDEGEENTMESTQTTTHPHPWTITSGDGVETTVRDDDGNEVSPSEMWNEVQRLLAALRRARACRDYGPGYEGTHGLGCGCDAGSG